jgi:RHS repeat-associated protein
LSRKSHPHKHTRANKSPKRKASNVTPRWYSWRSKAVAGVLAFMLLAGGTFAHWRAKHNEPLIAKNTPNPVKNISTASERDLADIPPEAFAPQPPTVAGYNAHSGGLPPGALPPGVVLPGMSVMPGGRTVAQGYGGYDGVRQQFTGKERDGETGLDYFGARYYSSAQGRFTSPDQLQSTSPQFALLGKGHPVRQALPNAELTNPQSLNMYHYALNNPLRYIDPDGQKPQDSFEARMQHHLRELNEGRITEQQYWERLRGAGIGGAVGVAVIIAARGGASTLTALSMWAARNPDKIQQVAQGLQEAAGGPPGLTLAANSSLRAAEISTGQRLATQLGVRLEESTHVGADYIVAGTKTAIDAIGTPDAYNNWARDNGAGFLSQLVRHVTQKSVDYVAVDLRGASKSQVKAINEAVNGLKEEQRNRVIYVR